MGLERSFVDENPNIKWCPASDCTCAIKASKGQRGVRCLCKHRFCFDCMLDDHRPCTCDDLKRWLIKCKDDSETYNWLMSNTKSCPKCGTSIEKNGGCNHITCKNGSCKHEWCWVCLGPWKDHSGSYYSCNMYNTDEDRKTEVEVKEMESRALTRGWIVSTSSRLTRRCTSAVTRCATRTSTRFISIRPPTSRQTSRCSSPSWNGR